MLKQVSRCAWVGAMSIVPLMATADPTPPRPNPAQPVNYIEWINQAFGGDITDNAYEAYRQACQLMTPFEGGSSWEQAYTQPWSDNKPVSDWLSANREGLRRFRDATRKGDCFFPLQAGQPTGEEKPELY